MPGIVTFTCNTIVRTSQDIENYPYNSYVNTGLTTTLSKGESYNVTLAFTIDDAISPHMNLRIWIDLNQDGQLDDPGETLLSVDHLPGPTYSGQITIPTTAMSGTTRMRVTAKMCSHGGHSLPTPCDVPPDPLGYHGEIEDYTVVIAEASGIAEDRSGITRMAVAPMPVEGASTLLLTSTVADDLSLDLLDATGRIIDSKRIVLSSGEHAIPLPFDAAMSIGTYLLRATSSTGVRTLPVVWR
jgi:hypothetical protein